MCFNLFCLFFQKFLQKELNISDSEIKNKIVNVKELEQVLSVILDEKGRSKEYLSTFLSNFILRSTSMNHVFEMQCKCFLFL